MNVRDFTLGDEPALQAVFYSAVHTIAASDYTPAQLDAWAPDRPDMESWTARMRAIRPFVVEEDGRILGYADLQANGMIDHFYVSGTSARRGVGRILMDCIHSRAEEQKLGCLFSDVSRTAQPFFEHFGFFVVEHRTVLVGDVSLPNARMAKDLHADGGDPANKAFEQTRRSEVQDRGVGSRSSTPRRSPEPRKRS